jgi:hypothetical protein
MTDEPQAQPPEYDGTPLSADPFDGADWGGSNLIGRPTAPRSTPPGPDGAEPLAEAAPVRQRVRIKKINRRRRRIVIWSSAGVATLLLLIVGWMLYTGVSAKSQLETVRDLTHKLRTEINSGDLDGARATADQISSHAKKAHDLTDDPLWALSSDLPFIGSSVQSARTLAKSVDTIAVTALPALVDASKSIDPATLREPDGSINIKPLEQVGPILTNATNVLNKVLAQIRHTPSSTLIGAVDKARTEALDQLSPLIKTISSANLAVQTMPTLLGAHGKQSYMVTFQNEAELRGTGGLAGAFAILSADNGKISFDKFEPDSTLIGVKSGVNLGTDFNQTYNAPDVTGDYRDANTSPNFPYAAQIWSAEWRVVSGQALNGVITLDPTALSYLLKVTGPAKLPKGSVVPTVSAANVVELTQQRAYADFGKKETAERKSFLLDVAKAASTRLASRIGNTTALVKAAGHAATEHRLLFWSADPSLEAKIADTAISGVTPQTSAPYAQVAINNNAGNKLDYYTHASMQWSAAGCGATRRVTVTLTVTNSAPTGLSKYVLGDTGKPGFPQTPGDNQLLISYYATDGAQLAGVLINNDQSGAQSGRELGHPVYTVNLLVPRGTTQTVVLSLTEPGTGKPIVRLQPMVNPMTAKTSAPSC